MVSTHPLILPPPEKLTSNINLIAIPTEENGGNHTIGFTRAAKTKEAHRETISMAKGIAIVGWRVLADDEFLDNVRYCYYPPLLTEHFFDIFVIIN